MLEHLFGMKICDQKTNIVSLLKIRYFHGLSSENNEILGPHHHKSCELMTKYSLDFIRLFNLNTDPNRVD